VDCAAEDIADERGSMALRERNFERRKKSDLRNVDECRLIVSES
jgi:hypothetical protein